MSDDTTPEKADVNPGDKVAGYRVEEQIGQGGMAVVYRALDERLDRRVALKVLAPGFAADNAFRTRFIRESRAAASVDHPNILPVYDAGDAGGCLFISMRYVQGGDVRSLLADGTALPPTRAWNIISQVASALDAAHARDLVHRDVKPANMLIDSSGKDTAKDADAASQSREHVYLSDFGISKQTVASNLTSTGQFVGTLDYIAPEQIEGQRIDGRADQYSLACAAYELLSAAPPFIRSNGFALINSHLSEQPPPITSLRPELPAAVDRALGKAMDKSPLRRYATCEQFASDLGRALGLLPGPLEADAGLLAGSAAETASPPTPNYQPTELAGPAPVAQAAQAVQAAQAGQAAQSGQESPLAAAPAAGPGVVVAGPGVAATDAGAPAGTDQQTMTAGEQGAPSGPQQAAAATGGQQAGAAQQWQAGPQWEAGQQWQAGQQWGQGQQWPSGQQWQAGPGQPGPYGQQYAPQATYPQPGGPGWPGWAPYPPQQPPKRSRGALIGGLVAAAAVIAAGAVVAVTLLNKPSPSPSTNNSSSSPPASSSSSTAAPPVATARSQATAVNRLLLSSEQSRSRWNSTTLVNNTGQCINIAGDVRQIHQIADQRSAEYGLATALQTNLIPNGAVLKSQLMRALHISLRIDNDYLAWAQQQQSSGCTTGTNSTYYQEATTLDSQATGDKQIFVNTWSPIATQYNLAQFRAGDI